MPVQIQMPNGGDELVDPGRVLTVREALAHEKDKSPEVQTAIWVGGSYIFPGESLASLRHKLSEAKFADLTAQNSSLILVAMPQVRIATIRPARIMKTPVGASIWARGRRATPRGP